MGAVPENKLLTFCEKVAILVVSTVESLLLNVFQSVALNVPVVEVPARLMDSACKAKLNPFAVPMVTLPVLVPLRLEPVTVPVAATLVGVIAPSVRVIAGVVVGVATVPLTPLAVVTETDVTEPPPLLLNVFQSVLVR